MLEELITIKDKVVQLLIDYPHLRDSDNKLIASYWRRDCKKLGYDVKTMSAFDVLKLYAEEKLTKAESIRRCRQKAQEQNQSLRGESYKGKQDEGDNVRDNIHDL